jgi:hypothetical protein
VNPQVTRKINSEEVYRSIACQLTVTKWKLHANALATSSRAPMCVYVEDVHG